jgi:acyl dehydratase
MKYPDILTIKTDPVPVSYSEKDSMLYALSIGMARNPLDSAELAFVYEKSQRVVPTLYAILAAGAGKIIEEGSINYRLLLHGEQRLTIHRPLPPQASLLSMSRCLSVVDKGAGHGALLNIESLITDAASSELCASSITTLFCRGDGGSGAPAGGALLPHEIPARVHDAQLALPTRPDQALLYRLNGDRNPLHCDPQVAQAAGFERPILHGLCTYGIACRAVLQTYCDYDAARLLAFDVRFASPVYPGDTILTRMWKDGPVVSFECSVAEREAIVIRNGRCLLS